MPENWEDDFVQIYTLASGIQHLITIRIRLSSQYAFFNFFHGVFKNPGSVIEDRVA